MWCRICGLLWQGLRADVGVEARLRSSGIRMSGIQVFGVGLWGLRFLELRAEEGEGTSRFHGTNK